LPGGRQAGGKAQQVEERLGIRGDDDAHHYRDEGEVGAASLLLAEDGKGQQGGEGGGGGADGLQRGAGERGQAGTGKETSKAVKAGVVEPMACGALRRGGERGRARGQQEGKGGRAGREVSRAVKANDGQQRAGERKHQRAGRQAGKHSGVQAQNRQAKQLASCKQQTRHPAHTHLIEGHCSNVREREAEGEWIAV